MPTGGGGVQPAEGTRGASVSRGLASQNCPTAGWKHAFPWGCQGHPWQGSQDIREAPGGNVTGDGPGQGGGAAAPTMDSGGYKVLTCQERTPSDKVWDKYCVYFLKKEHASAFLFAWRPVAGVYSDSNLRFQKQCFFSCLLTSRSKIVSSAPPASHWVLRE